MALAKSIIDFSVDLVIEYAKTGNRVSRDLVNEFAKSHFEKTSGVPVKASSKQSNGVKCSAVTAKGSNCTKTCKPGETLCSIHSKKKAEPAASTPTMLRIEDTFLTKKRQPKKRVPMHIGHGIGERSDECSLCELGDDEVDSVYKASSQ
jgi:hypothetical protein